MPSRPTQDGAAPPDKEASPIALSSAAVVAAVIATALVATPSQIVWAISWSLWGALCGEPGAYACRGFEIGKDAKLQCLSALPCLLVWACS
jgi:hypothetical protein